MTATAAAITSGCSVDLLGELVGVFMEAFLFYWFWRGVKPLFDGCIVMFWVWRFRASPYIRGKYLPLR
jgi:hypothetical protein